MVLPRPIKNERLRAYFAANGIRDAIVVPMRAEEGVIGTMLVANRRGDLATFDDDNLNLLETIARHMSNSLEKGRLLERLRQEVSRRTPLPVRRSTRMVAVSVPTSAW